MDIHGTSDTGKNHFRSVNLHSGYNLAAISSYSKGD